jgi:hypothetical protein
LFKIRNSASSNYALVAIGMGNALQRRALSELSEALLGDARILSRQLVDGRERG